VFTANGVDIFVDANDATTPTPVISHAILTYNQGRTNGLADGIVLSPSRPRMAATNTIRRMAARPGPT